MTKPREKAQTRHLAPCERCGGSSFSRNGTVRGSQRYRCLNCGFNFVAEPSGRWPGDAKLFNLFIGRLEGKSVSEIATDAKTTPQTVSRWLLDVWELKPWFVQAVAAQMVFEVVVASVDLKEALWGAVQTRLTILEGRGVDTTEECMILVGEEFSRRMKVQTYSQAEIVKTRAMIGSIISDLRNAQVMAQGEEDHGKSDTILQPGRA